MKTTNLLPGGQFKIPDLILKSNLTYYYFPTTSDRVPRPLDIDWPTLMLLEDGNIEVCLDPYGSAAFLKIDINTLQLKPLELPDAFNIIPVRGDRIISINEFSSITELNRLKQKYPNKYIYVIEHPEFISVCGEIAEDTIIEIDEEIFTGEVSYGERENTFYRNLCTFEGISDIRKHTFAFISSVGGELSFSGISAAVYGEDISNFGFSCHDIFLEAPEINLLEGCTSSLVMCKNVNSFWASYTGIILLIGYPEFDDEYTITQPWLSDGISFKQIL